MEDASNSAHERLQLVELTDSFVKVFAETREDSSMIPAEFRRVGIEHFTASGQDVFAAGTGTIFRMPGLPGLEIGHAEPDQRLAQLISSFSSDVDRHPLHEHRFENGRLIARTLVPSIAENQNCVQCHNEILQAEVYQIGDIMGAYVVERDMTGSISTDAKLAVIWFFASYLLLRAIGYRERSRKLQMMHLSSRVQIEEMKSAADAKEKFLLSHDPLTCLLYTSDAADD